MNKNLLDKASSLGLIIDKLGKFEDKRGKFKTLKINKFLKNFKEQNLSYAKQNILKGLHGSNTNDKLITLISGRIYWVALEYKSLNSLSPNVFEFNWQESDNIQIFVPRGLVIGFYVISDLATILYNQTEIYSGSNNQLSVHWKDPRVSINWPCESPILSLRDK